MASLHNKKDFEIGLLLSQSLRFKAYKTYITAILTRLLLKLCKNKNLRWSFKSEANAADKGKLYGTCSTPELSERNFCDRVEMKFTSPLGGIHQAGASETAAKSVTPCFTFG